jgi:hypothetical protein
MITDQIWSGQAEKNFCASERKRGHCCALDS